MWSFSLSFQKNNEFNIKKHAQEVLVNKGRNILDRRVNKVPSAIRFSEMTLTNNETNNIIKVIRSLEDRGILSKQVTEKM